jgi:hypothetical protein
VAEARALREIGIGTIAVMPNDTATYREDSFDNMKAFAAMHGFAFPYVIDETQEVARTYGAQCTPDFFGFNTQDELQYRGRLDASRTTLVPNARRDLFEAMKAGGRNRPWPRGSDALNGMFDQVEGLRAWPSLSFRAFPIHFPIHPCGLKRGKRNSYQKFAEVLAPQEADESARRILKPLDHVFAILDTSLTDPGGDIVHEIPVAPEKVGDDETAKRQPLGQDRSHQVRQKDWTG